MTETRHDLPRLRPEVTIGPALRSGPSVVHRLKDQRTGVHYRIGPREHFVIRRMDGSRTIEDIGREYTEEYGRVLGPDSWRQIFTLLGRHRLLDGMADEETLERLRRDREAERQENHTWLHRRWVLLRPDRLCTALAARLSFTFHPAFVALALLLAVAVQALVWSRAGTILAEAAPRSMWPVTVPVMFVLMGLITLLHELGHGVTFKHFGGTVTEIGVRWRFPLLTAYCRTDDIVLLHRRTARVGTAFAGVLVSLLCMVPVLGWWWLTEDGQWGHSLAAGLLLFGSAGALVNLLPFLQLDGYVMLSHALDMADLRGESYRYCRQLLSRRSPAARDRLRAYPTRDARLYALYGLVTLLFTALAYSGLMWLWYGSLRHWMGPAPAVLLLAAETALVGGVLVYAARRRTSERKTAHG
ncbi:M50 family metallopeptidase [Streptomyces sp. TP-A0874]|uniref:M50 family metallopeptidase n=1 Tax=Streptomyces sp. TP-A0874 TaxID=549819 RepID=UPI000853B56D|nr:M50 family metallopeptidase [Streptomyces sp. TP-A0874]